MKMSARLLKIVRQRRVLIGLVKKDLKSKYVGSALGIFWAVINPLLIALVITFVNTRIMKVDITHYSLFVLSALLPWFFFMSSIFESTGSLETNSDVLNQFVLQRELIPIATVLSNFVNFLIGFIVIMPFFFIFHTKISASILLLPFVMFLHFLFTLGIALSFSILNVYFRDLSQLLNVGMMFLFWITPIFYPLEAIPLKYHWVVLLNPAACYIEIYRSLLYSASHGRLFMWMLAAGFALVSLISGSFLFAKKEKEVLKYV